MKVGQLIRFYEEANTYRSPEQAAVEQAGAAGIEHASYHSRIVRVASLFGLLGALLGLGLPVGVMVANKDGTPQVVKMLLFAPFLYGAAGLLFGVAMACLFAPRSFLTGPVGQKWMKLIGTDSIVMARITCLLLGSIIGGIPTALGLFIAFAR